MKVFVTAAALAALTFDELDARSNEEGSPATVTYCEIRRGLLKYHVYLENGEYKLCNAGDYLLTDIPFDSFEAVLSYINNGEKF